MTQQSQETLTVGHLMVNSASKPGRIWVAFTYFSQKTDTLRNSKLWRGKVDIELISYKNLLINKPEIVMLLESPAVAKIGFKRWPKKF